MKSKIMMITGESGSGKTHFCAQIVNELRQGDLSRKDIRGILSTELKRNGKKTGIQAVNVVTYEHKNLAELSDGEPGPLSTKRWRFDPMVIAWCNSVFSKAVPCEVLIVDEIGPLELEQGKGFTTGLEAVDSGEYKLAMVVVRPHLIEKALERWPEAEVLNVEEVTNQEKAIEEIAQSFEGD
ncbi:MAG: nucleoside-triphosphatase [Anaerolineales bacterium]|jgi:nucleoside-triphosphatase THEP1